MRWLMKTFGGVDAAHWMFYLIMALRWHKKKTQTFIYILSTSNLKLAVFLFKCLFTKQVYFFCGFSSAPLSDVTQERLRSRWCLNWLNPISGLLKLNCLKWFLIIYTCGTELKKLISSTIFLFCKFVLKSCVPWWRLMQAGLTAALRFILTMCSNTNIVKSHQAFIGTASSEFSASNSFISLPILQYPYKDCVCFPTFPIPFWSPLH